jgi:hypothetical protein
MSRKNKRKKSADNNRPPQETGNSVKLDWTKIGILIGSVLTVITIVTAILIQYWSMRYGGSLKSSDMSLQLGDEALKQDGVTQIFVGAGSRFNIKDKVLIPVKLSVDNAGETVLSNVRIALVYDKRSQITIDDMDKYLELHGTLMPGDITAATNTSGSDGRVYTNFNMENLNVKGSKSISYGLQADEVDFRSRRLVFGVIQLKLEVLVEADGVPRKHFYLDYNVVPADDCANLNSMYQSFYGRLGYTELGQKSYTDYLVCANYRVLDLPGGRYWFPLGSIQTSKAIVHAASDSNSGS